MIAVINRSTRWPDADVRRATAAVSKQLGDFCQAWRRYREGVAFVLAGSKPPVGAKVITVFDNADQAGDLGWHSEQNGVAFGRVFAGPALDNGVNPSTVLSHEVLETEGDGPVNVWAEDYATAGTEFAVEVCDPVESDSYEVTLSDGSRVEVSNFVLPAWFDAQAHGPYDHLRRLTAPFSLSRGGYVVKRTAGTTTATFGDGYPAWRHDLKALGRGARRVAA